MSSIKSAGDLIAEAQAEISCLDVDSALRLYENSSEATILDVRESESAANAKLEQSLNISRGLLEMQVPKHISDPDALILTHCGGGGRASLAALTLQNMGYKNVHAITATFEDIKKAFG